MNPHDNYTEYFCQSEMSMSIQETELEYQAGYTRVMRFAEQARARGLQLSDRQLVHEIIQRERAAQIRDEYDYIICDCPPNFNPITKNSLWASDAGRTPLSGGEKSG